MNDLKPELDKTCYPLQAIAILIFAKKSSQVATFDYICEQAKITLASFNYYLRNKLCPYLKSWSFAFNIKLPAYQPNKAVISGISAEQQLVMCITSLIEHVTNSNAYSLTIDNKETPKYMDLLADIFEKEVDSQRQQILDLLKECLGSSASEQQIQFCHISIIGQCFQLVSLKQMHKVINARHYVGELNDLKIFIEHVVAFSLAGIQAIRIQNLHESYAQ